jgi:hypothetical protein
MTAVTGGGGRTRGRWVSGAKIRVHGVHAERSVSANTSEHGQDESAYLQR